MPFGLRAAVLGLVVVLASVSTAVAQWTASLEPYPGDGARQVAVLNGRIGEGLYLQFWCSEGDHRISLLLNDGKNDQPTGTEASNLFTIRPDSGGAWSSAAGFYRHADGWLGASYGNIVDMRAIAEGIISAKNTIEVSLTDMGTGQVSGFPLSASGSTAAGRQFLEACYGSAVAPSTAAAPSSTPAWKLFEGIDPINGGPDVAITGNLGQGGHFYATCDGLKRPMVGFMTANGSTFPYEAGDVGLNIAIQIDGEERSATGEYFSRPDGVQGIQYVTEPQYIESVIEAIGGARQDVAVMIHSYSNDVTTRWPAANLDGLANSVAGFSAHCFGAPGTVAESPAAPAAPDVVEALAWSSYEKPAPDGSPQYYALGPGPDRTGALVLSCTDPSVRLLAFMVPKDVPLPRGIETGTIFLTVAIDGEPFAFTGDFDGSAPDSNAIIADDSTLEERIIATLASGPSAISVIVHNRDTGGMTSHPILTNNVAEAATSFAEKCVAQTSAVAPEWTVLTGDAVGPYGSARMTGYGAPSNALLSVACAPGGASWGVGVVTEGGAAMPFGPDSGPFAMTMTSGDVSWELVGGVWIDQGGMRGAIVPAGDDFPQYVALLSIEDGVSVDVVASGGERARFAFGGEGFSESATELFSICLGVR